MNFKHSDIDLATLVTHAFSVEATERLGEVYESLKAHEVDFIAVLEKRKLLGLCSRIQLGTLLGQRYGFSLYHKRRVKDFLTPALLAVTTSDPITAVLTRALSRPKQSFFEDVALTKPDGGFIGLIRMRTLIQLQNRFFLEDIETLERQQEELDKKTRQMKGELMLAGQLQQAILTSDYPCFPPFAAKADSMLQFHHIYRSADLLGGDFFHIYQLSDHMAGIVICDVAGHGVKSALITSMMRALLTSYHHLAPAPGELLTTLNEKILHMFEGYLDSPFITACYMVIDLADHIFKIGNAGHQLPIRVQRKNFCCTEMIVPDEIQGPPIGILDNPGY